MSINQKLLTATKLSEVISIPTYTILQYTRELRIPAYKVGKHYLYDPDEVISTLKKKNKIN